MFVVAITVLLSIWSCGGGSGAAPTVGGGENGGDPGDNDPVVPTADILVAEWNQTAMSLTPTLGTHRGMRTLAMMHTAIFDAVMAFDGDYVAYHVFASPPRGRFTSCGGCCGGLAYSL